MKIRTTTFVILVIAGFAALGVAIASAQVPGASRGRGAAPGNLCLARTGNFLNVNCFVVKPVVAGQNFECTVQAYRLIKEVPGSFKCPDVYGLPHFDDKGNLIPYRYFQYGTGVRTWWALRRSTASRRTS